MSSLLLVLLLLLHRALLLLADPGGGCEGACGDVTVKPPFWLHASSEDGPSCGGPDPKFAVSCDAHNTTAALQGSIQGSYTIESIFYDNDSFLVHDPNVYLNGCPRRSFNLTTLFGLSQFRVSRKNRQIVFLDCPPPGLSAVKMNCGGDRYVFDGGWYGDDVNLPKVETLWCNSSFLPVVTLFGVVAEDWNMSLSSGFLLEWTPPYYVEAADTSKTKSAVVIAVVAVVGGVSFIAIGVFIFFYLYKRNKKRPRLLDRDDTTNEEDDVDFALLDFEMVVLATDNFSCANKLGQGGFGAVYKGKLPDGQEIAVKRNAIASSQGINEFKNEVKLIAKLQHRNLVRLIGCSIYREERMLIYEYMPNKSLDVFIFDQAKSVLLGWEVRYQIIVGIARGLHYLHEDSRHKIIHRDLKAANILLDKNMNPKISDFGIARMFDDEAEINTRTVVGTYGYALEGVFSVKSDVFSFGVLLLEIISGRKNRGGYYSNNSSLVDYAWNLWKQGRILKLVDEMMDCSYSTDEVVKCIKLGLLCVQGMPEDRPAMSYVLSMLSRDGTLMPEVKESGYTAMRGFLAPEILADKSVKCDSVPITILDAR